MATTGVGGVFLASSEPARLASWYTEVFGLTFQEDGGTFYVAFGGHDPREWTIFSIMPARSDVPAMPRNEDPADCYGDQPAMVDLRVDDLDAFEADLPDGTAVEHRQAMEGVGRFAWVRDPDGNRVEVWEPAAPDTEMA